jgi:DNA-binding MarR family transcriptional regulator
METERADGCRRNETSGLERGIERMKRQAERRKPTSRQVEILEVMGAHHARTGTWPTHRQMARALALNTTNLTPALRLLEAKGLIAEIPDASRRNRALTDLGWMIVSKEEPGTRTM